MNAIAKIAAGGQKPITMTSLELVDFINSHEGRQDLTHANFMAKVPKVLGEGGVIQFQHTYVHPQNGQTYPCYRFPKREACLMAMSYSYELQAKVFDRMTELEADQAPKLPQSMAQALRLAAEQAEVLERQQAQLALAAPKAEFVDRYVQAEAGSMGLRQVCKLLGTKETEFTAFLLARGLMYRPSERGPLTPRAEHIHYGRFKAKTGTAGHGDSSRAYVYFKFTAKGVEWIAGLWGQHKANAQAAKEV